MSDLLASLNWPTVALILGVIGIAVFHPQLRLLIARTRKLGRGIWEGHDAPQLPAPRGEESPADEFFRTFENQLLLEQEGVIKADLVRRRLEAPADREKALIKSLAATQIGFHFERVAGSIWASQIALLIHLNSRPAGDAPGNLKGFYDQAAKTYPPLYQSYPFDGYLGFLESYGLIQRTAQTVTITLTGREFLKYMLDARKVPPAFG